ncbi:hypothetical protein F5X99DRAFT_432261 [Biscogniauxia marginata]|nr:hypothetical protein F5X99DRAFT_432261 [Biscogniauxia marginata]
MQSYRSSRSSRSIMPCLEQFWGNSRPRLDALLRESFQVAHDIRYSYSIKEETVTVAAFAFGWQHERGERPQDSDRQEASQDDVRPRTRWEDIEVLGAWGEFQGLSQYFKRTYKCNFTPELPLKEARRKLRELEEAPAPLDNSLSTMVTSRGTWSVPRGAIPSLGASKDGTCRWLPRSRYGNAENKNFMEEDVKARVAAQEKKMARLEKLGRTYSSWLWGTGWRGPEMRGSKVT